MFCANCGKEIKEGMNFCSSCGSKIEPTNKEKINNISSSENNTNYIDIKDIKNDSNSTSDFYMDIKGIKSRFDHGYNTMQVIVFIIFAFIGYWFWYTNFENKTIPFIAFLYGIFFLIIFPIIVLIIATKLNPRGVFIDMQNGVLIKNKKTKLSFLKDELHLKEVFAIQVKSFKIEAYTLPKGTFKYNKNIFLNVLFGSGEFYKFTFFDKNGSSLLNIHLTNKNDRDKLIEALKTVFNILGKYDVQIEVNNSVSRDFDELAM